jgi:hypothetical protein
MRACRAWKLAAVVCVLFPASSAIGGNNGPTIALAQNSPPSHAASDSAAKNPEDSKPTLAPIKKLTVRVLDPEGNPVVGAHVGLGAHLGTAVEPKKPADTDADGFVYEWHQTTNSRGVAEIEAAGADIRPLLQDQGIIAREAKRHLVGVAYLDPTKAKDTIAVKLAPECRVAGKVMCPELKQDKRPLGPTTISLGDEDRVVLTYASDGTGEYRFFVPPGQYLLGASGNNIFDVFSTIVVPPKEPELLFEPMIAPAGKLALLEGQPAPELHGAVAWKNGPPVTIESLRGKCVLLFFWRASSPESLAAVPAILDLQDKLKKAGLAVIGVHVDVDPQKKPVESVPQLDEMLAKVRTDAWKGRDISFPVAIVPPRATPFGPNFHTTQFADSQAAADYGVTDYPTVLLINRHGVLVSELDDSPPSIALLQKTLGLKVTVPSSPPSKTPAVPPPTKNPAKAK